MRKYTKEQLLFFLKKFSSELKRTPTIIDITRHPSYPSASTYAARFSTWNNALKEAGLPLNNKKEYKKEDLLENLVLLRKELGRTPKPADLKNRRWAGSYATYIKNFGSWKEAVRQAGLNLETPATLKSFLKRK